jgi:DNA-binding transcriptional regulator YiaG
MKMNIKVKDNKLFIGKKGYAIEKKLQKKLDRIVRGITQKNPKEDAILINEGKEGKGKTNTSIVEGAYVKAKTGKDIHLFFNLEPMMEFGKRTKEKIIIWDEPSLDSLSTDQIKRLNKDMQRFFMTVRKKRHFFIINYTKFWKFPEYMVVDRSIGMVKMNEYKMGRFLYIRKVRLEFLWNQYKRKKKRDYKKASSFGGVIPNIFEKHFKEIGINVNNIKDADYDTYEIEKDKAIESIGKEKKSKKEILWEKKLKHLRKKVSEIPKRFKIRQVDLASFLKVNSGRLREWKAIEIEE